MQSSFPQQQDTSNKMKTQIHQSIDDSMDSTLDSSRLDLSIDQAPVRQDHNKRERMSMQKIFTIIIVGLVLVLGPFTYMMYDLIQYAMPLMPQGYQMPLVNDFGYMLISAALFLVLEPLFAKFAYPYYYHVCKEKVDEEQRVLKTKKAVVTIFKFFYFCYASLCGYLMLKDTHVLPPILGGQGSFRNHIKDWPFIQQPEGYRFFFMSCAGYHLAGLIDIFREENRKHKSFIEYTMHQIVTMYLLIFSYLGNLFIGAPVLLLHNASDLMVAATRIVSDSDFQELMPVLTLFTLSTWIYTRLFCFGILIYQIIFDQEYFTTFSALPSIFGGLLLSLYLLHSFWTFLMIKILIKFVQKGSLEDTVNNHVSEQRVNNQQAAYQSDEISQMLVEDSIIISRCTVKSPHMPLCF
ncbi:hypothetical protein FGO68_gene8906 [Halteria grandinella]|uniref:TLC domain-containing protein n=1 Tax=Halteria grandinella TaxID=5974 RepID=A0A8J8NVC5_HALGN|nr:hypothetical protein FGO68_gene8906 [Halteria grandinella]